MNAETLERAQVLAELGSWEWNIATGCLEFSEEMYRLVGLWPQTPPIRFRDLLHAVHPVDRHQITAHVRHALAGTPLRADCRFRLPDGRVRWIHCEGEVSFDHAGRAVQMLGTALDVTQHRRGCIEQLEVGERVFRALVENAHDVIFRFRVVPDIGFDYLSPSAGYYTGLSPEEMYRDPNVFFARVHPDDLPLVARAIADPEKNSPYQVRVLGRGGKWLWAEQVLVPIRNFDGKLVAIEGVSRDVTFRKEAEAEREKLLRRISDERRWLGTVLAQLPVAVVLIRRVDGEEVEVAANSAAEALLGANLEGDIRHVDGALVERTDRPRRRALSGKTVGPQEYRLHRSDGSEVPVLGSACPIHDAADRVMGSVEVWEDLTTVKELERMRQEWTSVVAHDLRQPITLIRAYAELLMRSLADERHKHRVAHISEAAGRLGRMIEDLLDVSRIEARRLSLEKVPVDLCEWAHRAIEHARRQLPTTRVHLHVEGTPGLAMLDPLRLEQVLVNLLSNAAKYGDRNSPVEVLLAGHPGEFELSVRNRGTPIPEEQLPLLFTRFHRIAQQGPKVPGLGLGLYISRGLVEAHGGHIRAQSDPAGFNTFSFRIPTGAVSVSALEEPRV